MLQNEIAAKTKEITKSNKNQIKLKQKKSKLKPMQPVKNKEAKKNHVCQKKVMLKRNN